MNKQSAAPKLAPLGQVIKAEDFGFYSEAQTLLLRAQEQCARDIEAAKQEAALIIESATSNAQSIREEAAAQAATQRQQSEPSLRAELQDTLNREYAELLLEANARLARSRINIEHEVIELAIATLRHLFGSMPRGKRVAATALRALDVVRSDSRVELRLHPDDLAEASRAIQEATLVSDIAKLVDLRADLSVEPGMGELLTRAGRVDVNLEQTFAKLAQNLRHAAGAFPEPETEVTEKLSLSTEALDTAAAAMSAAVSSAATAFADSDDAAQAPAEIAPTETAPTETKKNRLPAVPLRVQAPDPVAAQLAESKRYDEYGSERNDSDGGYRSDDAYDDDDYEFDDDDAEYDEYGEGEAYDDEYDDEYEDDDDDEYDDDEYEDDDEYDD